MKRGKNSQSMFQTILLNIHLLIQKAQTNPTMFLSKILGYSCSIKYYIIKEITFVIASNLLVLHKHKKDVNYCFQINRKQMIQLAKNTGTVKVEKHTRKTKSLFMIYVDFNNESLSIPDNNGEQMNLTQTNAQIMLHFCL